MLRKGLLNPTGCTTNHNMLFAPAHASRAAIFLSPFRFSPFFCVFVSLRSRDASESITRLFKLGVPTENVKMSRVLS